MLDTAIAYAMGGGGAQSQGAQSPLALILPFVIIFIIFYFLLIRPQKVQQRKHQEMIEKLKKNDKIVTTGGIHATIVNVKDTTFVVKVDENTKIEIQKSSVARIL